MKKAWLLLSLAIIMAVQLTVLSSFSGVSEHHVSVSGTSAVVVGKMNYVSLRVTFAVFAQPGYTAFIMFPNGTQIEVVTQHFFEVFLPKTEPEPILGPGSFSMSRYSEGVFVTDQEPMDVAVVSNVSEDFFNYKVGPDPDGKIIFYWFKIQGNAEVSVSAVGVTI